MANWVNRHISISKLDYVRLGTVARQISAAVKQQQFRRFVKQEIADLLLAAVRDGLVKVPDLDKKLQKELFPTLLNTA